MVDSFDPERKKRMFQDAQQSGPSNPGWTPLSAAAVNSTFAASSDFTQYEIIEPLGHGGMGAVYRARDTKTSREVAIKLLRHDALHDDAFVARFKKESHNLRRVNHHNVVRVFDEGEVDGYPFFVMELLEGHTLASKIERSGRMPLADIRRIMGDICSGLQAVHEEGLVHRDLKAANIFLVNDGRVVILDFGLARDVTAKPSTLSVAGSEGHIAPEVLKGEPATQLSDIFSGGVIYLHLLTGTIPRGGQVQLHETYGLDPRLDAIVKKACNENPNGRYQSAQEFAEAVEATMSPVPPRPVEPEVRYRDNPSSSPVPAKTKEKTDDATSGSTAPIPTGIIFLSEAESRLYRADVANWKPLKPPKTWESTLISEHEDWKVIDQWDAFPEIPPFKKVKDKIDLRQKFSWAGGVLGFGLTLVLVIIASTLGSFCWLIPLILIAVGGFFLSLFGNELAGRLFDRVVAPSTLSNPSVWNWHSDSIYTYLNQQSSFGPEWNRLLNPKQLFWHLREPRLFATRDHCHFTGWRWETEKVGPKQPEYSHLRISDDSNLFSVGAMNNLFFSDSYNFHFLVKSQSYWLGGGGSDHWIIYDSRGVVQSALPADSSVPQMFGDLRSNPLRPAQSHYDTEILAFPSNGILSLCRISKLPKFLNIPGYDVSKLQDFAETTIDLLLLPGAEQNRVGSFAWHPSGRYLVIEISGSLYLLRWNAAQLVASLQSEEKYEAVAWSPDGTLLAVDRQLSKVWDIRTNEIRPLAPHERWDYRPAGSLDNQLKSCDGLRSFSSHQGGPNFPIKNWEDVTDIAWSPDDPDIFATVGGKDCPRDIRIWQRVK